ncbi:MAG: peptidoglycan-associated lipoprotein Pal [Candidatus Thiodiazotropha sp. (ex Lucinoma aequizonata)]|nr:peptidoglycan-associated lipoprotein Pal [Candidatus Thiodiazotropha sp. (ex Lucinoma aequizonata)]MCU7889264.1 peptidoglycan-associated lipoprotein Pal [Candidatus Thiodiazotropha sp. (ex Lucinoma aequizonata)]MCU7893694.1 peptidoglycan-associated lipoprotein Pal [Candidatus Thiodiazotropha sp. (ex Lucinoma aequizonata)]MCU7899653.1 peptidoglycan-associated lipoprotein Pal [Candidatus Thiodiazotropha sp. (ex Lucinoma aequizonata)]MCU7900600.1 peptidoglycan-associated lipoprotein Pal [Candid
MKKMSIVWIPILLSLLLLVGCSSTPTSEGGADVSEQSTGANGSDANGSGASTSAASQGSEWQGDPLENPNGLLATRVIYFDFDMSTVWSDYMDVIQAHADYLAANPEVVVRLEGHADEKGTREYNLGLGENRANAVRSLMLAQGVSDNQLVVVSYGEEQPAAFEHNDESLALNRRVELIY